MNININIFKNDQLYISIQNLWFLYINILLNYIVKF